jgi:hypothetical protein
MTVVVLLVFLFRAAITASTMMSKTTAAPAQIQIGSVYQTVLLPEVVIPTFTGSWSVNMDPSRCVGRRRSCTSARNAKGTERNSVRLSLKQRSAFAICAGFLHPDTL